LTGGRWEGFFCPGDDAREGIGVDHEDPVHRLLVRGAQLRVAVVAEAPGRAGHWRVVGDVARGLLEVRAEPRALQDLRQDVRGPLAGDVRAAELDRKSTRLNSSH